MATASHAAPEPPREFSLQRFALGLSVLCVTCVLTNLEATVRNPARLFDVLPPSAAAGLIRKYQTTIQAAVMTTARTQRSACSWALEGQRRKRY